MDIEAIRQLKADIRKQLEEKGSREARTSGNPNESENRDRKPGQIYFSGARRENRAGQIYFPRPAR